MKFISQAKYGHHVISPVGMVVHNALALSSTCTDSVESQIVVRLLGRLVVSRNCLGIGVPFDLVLLCLFKDSTGREQPLPSA